MPNAFPLSDLPGLATLLFAGLLAGEEVVIRYGVRDALRGLDPPPQIRLRQALIRRLRVLVPAIFFLALGSAAVAFLLSGAAAEKSWRLAGLFALLAFIIITLAGTVPINRAALAWSPDAPPDDWRRQIARWERLDTARTWAAVSAFVLFLASSVWW